MVVTVSSGSAWSVLQPVGLEALFLSLLENIVVV